MSKNRPDLDAIRTNNQVPDDEIISYRPRIYGAVNIPFTEGREMTKTEGQLLDRLTLEHGLLGLSQFRDIARNSFAEGERRFPDNTLPSNIPSDRAREWQGNDGHRDAFRHAFWSAQLAQKYGAEWATAFTTAHEGVPGNWANREAMDLHNNSVGIQIGAANRNASPEQLANLVEQAVNQGKTVVVDRNGSLEWSDRVTKGQHGLSPDDVIGPRLQTPGVVSTQSVASLSTPTDPQTVAVAAADQNKPQTLNQVASNVAKMQEDPMYGQVVTAMNTKGLDADVLAPKVYADAVNARLAEVKNVEVGKQITDANGNPDRTIFAFDGTRDPVGLNHSRTSENEARATSVQVAANSVEQTRAQQIAQPDQQERKPISLTV